jgi:hypothetical protein
MRGRSEIYGYIMISWYIHKFISPPTHGRLRPVAPRSFSRLSTQPWCSGRFPRVAQVPLGGGVTGNEQDSYGLNWSNTFGSFVKLRISKDTLPASTLTFILYMHVSPNVSSCFTCLWSTTLWAWHSLTAFTAVLGHQLEESICFPENAELNVLIQSLFV